MKLKHISDFIELNSRQILSVENVYYSVGLIANFCISTNALATYNFIRFRQNTRAAASSASKQHEQASLNMMIYEIISRKGSRYSNREEKMKTRISLFAFTASDVIKFCGSKIGYSPTEHLTMSEPKKVKKKMLQNEPYFDFSFSKSQQKRGSQFAC